MSASKNRGLGKGLEALFGDVEINLKEDTKGDEGAGENILLVDINEIKPNASQPRKDFNDEKIEELAGSIKNHGLIQPIVLRKSKIGYEIIAGERRWRAARKAGLKEIPSVIKELTDEQNALLALIENMQREDLNAIEEAAGLMRLASEYGLTQEEISKNIGKSRPYVANSLRLLKLPEAVREMIADSRLTSGHGKAIAGVKNTSEQISIAKKCVSQNWTVRDVEKHIKGSQDKKTEKKAVPRQKNRELMAIEDELKDIFGTKVNIKIGSKKGKIEIEYYSRSELERLVELFQDLK
jgi:ParB family chromosome partitioning protein